MLVAILIAVAWPILPISMISLLLASRTGRGVRFQTKTEKPFRRRFAVTPRPIIPRPITPTFLCFRWGMDVRRFVEVEITSQNCGKRHGGQCRSLETFCSPNRELRKL